MEPFELPDFGTGLRPPERDAEHAAAHRGDPQRVGGGFTQRVDETQLLGDGQFVDFPVVVGVIVQSVAVSADPQQVAAAFGERVDRVVEQGAVRRRDLLDVRRIESFALVVVGDAQRSFALGAYPEAAFVVDVERTDGFGEVVGQVVESNRPEGHGVARVLVKPLSVGADPNNSLPGVAQQRHDAACDVDVFGGVFHAVLGRGLEPDDAVGAERYDVIVIVADDVRHAAHGRQLFPHVLYIDNLPAGDVEFVEHVRTVDEVDAVLLPECVFGLRGECDLLDFAETELPAVAGRDFHGHAVDALAGETPEVAVVVERHLQDVGVSGMPHGLHRGEFVAGGVVIAELVVLRDDNHFAAAPCHDSVHSLEAGVGLDPLAVGVEQIESVVGAYPEQRVGRYGNLLDEVARERCVAVPVVGEKPHALPVPHVQAVAGTYPDESVFVLRQGENGVVGEALAAGNLPQVAGVCRYAEQQERPEEMYFPFHGRLRLVGVRLFVQIYANFMKKQTADPGIRHENRHILSFVTRKKGLTGCDFSLRKRLKAEFMRFGTDVYYFFMDTDCRSTGVF